MGGGAWQPVLDGDDARRALAVAREIADAVSAWQWPPEAHGDPDLDTVARGDPGLAVFLAQAARVFDEPAYAERAEALLQAALERAPETLNKAQLHSGFAGLGWAVEQVGQTLGWAPAAADDDPIAVVDELALAALEGHAPSSRLEVMFGAAGFLVYAAARWPRPAARRIAELVVGVLDASAERGDDGDVTWFSSPARLGSDAAHFPQGYYSLGIAHGVPGIMAALAIAHRLGAGGERPRQLFLAAGRWLRQWRLPDATWSCLPTLAGVPGEARTAWCYGDVGVAAALWPAARALGDEETASFARALAHAAAARAPEHTGVADAMFCHGAGGLAHLLARLAGATGDAALRESARRWLGRALAMRRAGEGVAGFVTAELDPSTHQEVVEVRPGLLDGAAGLGLVLLAAATTGEPSWDRLFLLSL